MALKGPFTYYLDMIIDSFLLANFIQALDGIGNVIQNYNSFPSTVSILQGQGQTFPWYITPSSFLCTAQYSHLNNCSHCKVPKISTTNIASWINVSPPTPNPLAPTLLTLSKSHAKTVLGPQNLPKDRRSWGRFCRSPNSLCMGFTFLMDANTSNYFYNYFMGVK